MELWLVEGGWGEVCLEVGSKGGVPCGGREVVEEQVMVELQCSGEIRDGRYARARD